MGENGIRLKRGTKPNANDGGAKIIVALLAGAGAAFLLALILLMSRLESEESTNGLLNSNVGGAKGVDDAIYLEEVAQGHASPFLLPKGDQQQQMVAHRQSKLMQHIAKVKGVYDRKLHKFERAFNLPKDNPLGKIIHEGEDQLEGMAKALGGKGQMMPQHANLVGDFKDAIHKDNERDAKRREKRARKDRERDEAVVRQEEEGEASQHQKSLQQVALSDGEGGNDDKPPHLFPLFPPLPPRAMAEDLFGSQIITNTLSQNKPTVAGIIAILQNFLQKLHQFLIDHKHDNANDVIDNYFNLVTKYLAPLEEAYRDREIFPVREDGSIFMSLGAYRDHLLGETLRQAFKNARHPDKLFVGAVVQNCFGIDVQCRTGVEVKGKDAHGRPMTQVSDRGPDVNGIEQFCTDPEYSKYCESGQIRALYVNETESNGPTTARYFASKLWGGETYFLQADAHLRFAPDWDQLYQDEVKVAKNYPKAVLSSYPPGFSEGDAPYTGGSKGTRLCTCTFSDSDVEHKILRINTGNMCNGEEEAPSQIAYIAAGFFFARAEFLVDVPFDPYLPWCCEYY